MIQRREILDTAATLGLGPQVVEKDYVLGWVLAGIYQHAALAEHWVFKGGTCLKKCYFETYRFSEDLDFTVTDPSQVQEKFLSNAFQEVAEWIYEQAGIEIPQEFREFRLFTNPRGTVSCQGKLSYRGPIAPRSGGLPRVKLDLTQDELLVLPAAEHLISHDYSDAPAGGITVRCYAYEEAFGEKTRALGERARPRDLYDVINLYRNVEARPRAAVLLDVLQQKCRHRRIRVPTLADLEAHREDLEGSWQPMLGHQLRDLPPVESFWDALPEFFGWLRTGVAPAMRATYRLAAGETVLRERTLRLPVAAAAQSHLEIVRFAAANHLCVDLAYQGSVRRIEPYSLRRTQEGNIVLHAIRTRSGEHRSYRVDRIDGAQVTRESFAPRYAVELSPHGSIVVAPTSARPASAAGRGRTTRVARPGRRRNTSSGPRYIYECMYCRKRFFRKKRTSRLNAHKDKFGRACSGRTAIYVDTRY